MRLVTLAYKITNWSPCSLVLKIFHSLPHFLLLSLSLITFCFVEHVGLLFVELLFVCRMLDPN